MIALASDYDGTLARDGIVADRTIAALSSFKESGGRVILITGRQLDDLLALFPRGDLIDRIVAENGAILCNPSDGRVDTTGEPPPREFMDTLRARGVSPLDEGRVIVATVRPHEHVVRETIHDLGLDLHVVLNNDAVMILPRGIDKGSGLTVALSDLRLSTRDTVGVGDAQNDEPFLERCAWSFAVANALPELKGKVDRVTAENGDGVVAVISWILQSGTSVTLRREG